MGMVNHELYKIFYVVAKSGSITKAAQELFISQPAVSQSIKQLEGQIGGRLFLRTSRGMEMTYEGRAIYDYIKQANMLIEMAEKKFSQMKELTYGEIRIGASDTITKHFLLKFISEFVRVHPDVSVKITNRTSGETLKLLKEGKVDIGFVNAPIDDDYIDIKDCDNDIDVFVCSPEMKKSFSGDGKLSMKNIASLPLIMLEKLSNSRKVIDEFFENSGVDLKPIFELGSLDLMLDMAKIGLGVAIAPSNIVKKDIENGELSLIDLDFSMPLKTIALISIKDVPLNFSATEFVKLILTKKIKK